MFGFGKSKGDKATKEDGFKGGMAIFANFAAMIATFFGTGPAYSMTIDFVIDFSDRHYGPDLGALIEIAWFILVAGSIYGLSRATIYTSIVSLAVVAAARIL